MNRKATKLCKIIFLALVVSVINLKPAYSNTYFPETLGFYWNYNSSDSPGSLYKTTLNSHGKLLIGEVSNFTAYQDYVIIQDSVYNVSGHIDLYGELYHSYVYTPHTLIVPSSTVPGIYQSEIINSTEAYAGGSPSTSTYLYTLEVIGFEDVSVPAGNFSNCLKLYSEFTDSEGFTFTNNTSWLAQNVGTVKREGTYFSKTGTEPPSANTMELVSYGITPAPIPSTIYLLLIGFASIFGLRAARQRGK